jgi:hypothetical protein
VFSAHSNCWVDQTELIENTIDEREEFPYIRRRLTEQRNRHPPQAQARLRANFNLVLFFEI